MIGLMKAVERLVYARSAMIVPIAEQFRALISARGVPNHKLRTIPDCVDLDLYRAMPRKNAFAAEHGLLDDFVVLYGGNIGLVQDWESVLTAASQTRDLPIQFVIVGDGGRRQWLEREVASRGLPNVKLIGYQPKDRMPEINAACDLAIVPLTVAGAKDGFPSKVYRTWPVPGPSWCRRRWVRRWPLLWRMPDAAEVHRRRTVPHSEPRYGRPSWIAANLEEEGRRGRELIEREYSKEAVARRFDILIRELTKP